MPGTVTPRLPRKNASFFAAVCQRNDTHPPRLWANRLIRSSAGVARSSVRTDLRAILLSFCI